MVWEIGKVSDSLNFVPILFSFLPSLEVPGSSFPECLEFFVGNQCSQFSYAKSVTMCSAFQLLKVLLL